MTSNPPRAPIAIPPRTNHLLYCATLLSQTRNHLFPSQESCDSCPGADALELSVHNFTEYRTRFHAVTLNAGANSGSKNNLYYSFTQGLTHFVVFSAEAYAHSQSADFLANQLAFMKADLAAVDRSKTPWVVGLVHRDFIMLPEAFLFFGPVLEDAGVDVMFCGHVLYS